MTYLIKVLQTVRSPVKNIFKAVNIVLVLIIVTLLTMAIGAWMSPRYPDKFNVASVTYGPKTLKPLVLNRKVNNARVINTAVQKNLFRKDRRDFSPPVQIAKAIPISSSSILPPPDLKLKGVLLLVDKKIAIIETNHSVREGNQGIKKKHLKKREYELGAKIGNFELTEIKKTRVTLNNNRGVVLNLNLAQRPEDKVIRKVGNTLVQKDKNFDPGNIKKVSPPRSSYSAALKRPIKKPKPVRTQSQSRPSAGTGKNPLVAQDIVLSEPQLREIAKGPYRSPLPAHLFENPQYRQFLAGYGIESIEDLKVISKAQAIRRAARKHLRVLQNL